MAEWQRTGRRLKFNHSNALPRYIIAYDTETLPDSGSADGRTRSHRFRLGVAITARIVGDKPIGKKTHRIETPEQFWKLVERFTASNYTTWVICHNTLFDMVVSGLPEQFEQGKLVIEWPRTKRTKEDNQDDNVHARTICIIDSPPTIIAAKVVANGGRIVFVDTLNWFTTSLRNLGETIGKAKTDMPAFSASRREWFDYCSNDAEIVFDTFVKLIQWVKSMDMGMFRYTAPSQAMSAYRHRFMKHDICVHDNADVKNLERRGYFGGRTEVFKMGRINETVHQFDANSLFPAVMRSGQFPRILRRYEFNAEYRPPSAAMDYGCMVAEVDLDTNSNIYPLRTKQGIMYPIGRFQSVLVGEELKAAVRSGHVRGIRSWSEYELAPIFKHWVDELWELRRSYREQGNATYAEFTKKLLNSLYGKFGQRSPEWTNAPGRMASLPWSTWTERDLTTGERRVMRSFGWQVQCHSEKAEIDGTFVAVSAFVTAASRMYMNQIRSIIGRENCYYQGVDSIVVTNAGRVRLEMAGLTSETNLGLFRLQLSTNDGEIIGCNDYRMGQKRIISGRSMDAETLENGHTLQKSFSAAKYMFSGLPIDHVQEEWVEWQKVKSFTKGIVGQDGWVSPPVITTSVSGSMSGDKSTPETAEAY